MNINEIHFDSNYRGDSLYPEDSPLRAIYQDMVPWDIGGPQPVVVNLESSGEFQGQVLDIGCGLGDNALFLAERGHEVTALDISPTAIKRASMRADSLGLKVNFVVADAITLKGLEGLTFNTVVDSALYHGLRPEQRRRYVAALHQTTERGSRLHIACFADVVPTEILSPNRSSEQDIRETLAESNWAITRFEHTTYTANPAFTRDLLHQIVRITSATRGREFVDSLDTDEKGRLLLPIWLISANRV